MRNKSGKSEGERHFELVKKNIPRQYSKIVRDENYVRNGRVYERMLKQILEHSLPNSEVGRSPILYPIKREKKQGGYVKPDLCVDNNVFIEVTGWGDSNMIFSKIMQGYLVKQKYPKSKYFVVITDLYIEDEEEVSWTWNDVKLWDKWSKIEDVKAVDGWFGFKNIDELINKIKK